jgi:hypothetical protein
MIWPSIRISRRDHDNGRSAVGAASQLLGNPEYYECNVIPQG